MQRSRSLRRNQSSDRARSSSSALNGRIYNNNQEPLIQTALHHQSHHYQQQQQQQQQHSQQQQQLHYSHQPQYPHTNSRGSSLLTRSISSQTVHNDGASHRNKNIPMHPQLKRWNTSNDLSKRYENDFGLTNGSGGDPSNYGGIHVSGVPHTKRASKTSDHSYENRTIITTTPISSAAHNSMHSLVPMPLYEEKMSSFQSESDDSDDETNYMWIPSVDNSIKKPIQDGSRSGRSRSASTVDSIENTEDIQNVLNEISDFQSNFVQKYNADIAGVAGLEKIPISRIQQKILDYKELQEYSPDSSRGGNIGGGGSGSNPFDYNMKIQNETITSQYTLIRLRFNSGSSMGLLGYLNRSANWDEKGTREADSFQVSSENKDVYISDLWRNEMKLFNDFKSNTNAPSEQTGGVANGMGIGNGSSRSSSTNMNSSNYAINNDNYILHNKYNNNINNTTNNSTDNMASVNVSVRSNTDSNTSSTSSLLSRKNNDTRLLGIVNLTESDKLARERGNLESKVVTNVDSGAEEMEKSNSSLSEMAKNIHLNNYRDDL